MISQINHQRVKSQDLNKGDPDLGQDQDKNREKNKGTILIKLNNLKKINRRKNIEASTN